MTGHETSSLEYDVHYQFRIRVEITNLYHDPEGRASDVPSYTQPRDTDDKNNMELTPST